MILRRWQKECIQKSYQQYNTGQTHFLCLATPGAGKTLMASILAKKLLDENKIDLIICFSPSVIVATDFKTELETQLGQKFDGLLGSRGSSLTYQSMLCIKDDFWELFIRYRVFVIFDEIHHCAGNTVHNANAWGEKIISKIQGKASYTLALTGTPWRSDCTPIVLAKYRGDDMKIHCDYQYGLSQAVDDRVCRLPQLTMIDNNKITLCHGSNTENYHSFSDLLKQSECNYLHLIECEELILYILRKANKKLSLLRKQNQDAGGLIVAASVAHAKLIQLLMRRELGENAVIVTYLEDNAVSIINDFRCSSRKWIISIGMISEGTNIPRLRVCCHLTRVKTELYFRQVLGRILRANGKEDEKGFFYMPAEPRLVEYAHRIADDIPSSNVVALESMAVLEEPGANVETLATNELSDSSITLEIAPTFNDSVPVTDTPFEKKSILAQSYESTINIFGRFKLEVIAL